jgi:hypothetical protein
MQETQLGHGCIESVQSHTDINFENVKAGLPTLEQFKSDYTGLVHENQRAIGICTAIHLASKLHKLLGFRVSAQFIYVLGKKLIDKNTWEGSSIKTMLEIIRVYGAPRLELVPTDDTTKSYEDYINVTFSPEAYADALKNKIQGYAYVNPDLDSILEAGLKDPSGVSIMIQVGDNWYRDANGNITWDGARLSPLRDPQPLTGAHATTLVEGNNQTLDFNDRNTWGDSENPIRVGDPTSVWGNNGDIRFNWKTQQPYIKEAYIITSIAPATIFRHTFNQPIVYGQQDNANSSEVTSLQRVLVRLGFLKMPAGVAYGFYGSLTAFAVFNYQVSRQVSTLSELNALQGKAVGPATRKALSNE